MEEPVAQEKVISHGRSAAFCTALGGGSELNLESFSDRPPLSFIWTTDSVASPRV